MSYSEESLDKLESGNLEEFENSFKKALDNDTPEILYSLAEELYSLGFTSHAKRIYEQGLKNDPDEDVYKINLAEIAIDDDDIDTAINFLSDINKNSDEYLRALLVMADLYQTQELFEVSEQKLLEAYRIAPDEPVITFALAEFYYSTRNYRKAIAEYLKLIRQGVTSLSSVNIVERLGVSYAEIGQFENAVGYLDQIKQVDMNSDVKFELGFTYLKLKDYKKAIGVFEDLLENDPNYTSLYPALADAYIEDNQVDKALVTIQEGLSVDQYNEKLWLKAAKIANRASNDQLVTEYLIKGLEIDPENYELISMLADWYINNNQYQKVIDLLTPLNDENSLDSILKWNLASANAELGNINEAVQLYQQAENELVEEPDFLKESALFFREVGDVQKSNQLVKLYLQIVPNDFEMNSLLDDY